MFQGSIKKGAKYLASVSVVLCALWFAVSCSKDDGDSSPSKFEVTFSAGAGSGTVAVSQEVAKGKTIFLPGQGEMVAPERKVFDGWKIPSDTSKKIYDSDEAFVVNADVRFVAQWRADDRLKVTFGLGEGSGTQIASIEVAKGEVIRLPGQEEMTAPSWKEFAGWKITADTENKIYAKDESFAVNADVRFVAQWTTGLIGYSTSLLPAIPDFAENNKGALTWREKKVAFYNTTEKQKVQITDGVPTPVLVRKAHPQNGEESAPSNSSTGVSYGGVNYNIVEIEYSPCGYSSCTVNGKERYYGEKDWNADKNFRRNYFANVPVMEVTFIRDTLNFENTSVTPNNLDAFVELVYKSTPRRKSGKSRSVKNTWTATTNHKDSIAGTIMQINAMFAANPAAVAALAAADPTVEKFSVNTRYSSFMIVEEKETTKQDVADKYIEEIKTSTGTIKYTDFSVNSIFDPGKNRTKDNDALVFGGALGFAKCTYNNKIADIKQVVSGVGGGSLVVVEKGGYEDVFEMKLKGDIEFSGAFSGTISFNNVYYKSRDAGSPEVRDEYYSKGVKEFGGEIVIKSGTQSEIKLTFDNPLAEKLLDYLTGDVF